MTRAEKAERIGQVLDELYPELEIPLDHRDPFTLLVAVALSAQTTDKKVNQVTPALFARAGTPAALAALSVDEIQALIREVGLANQKAKNLQRAAEILVAEHGGQVPRDLEALERLPGVGHKTASVVMVQVFGEAAFPVDTHIHRLAWRWGLADGSSVVATERALKKLFPREEWGRRHLQMIYCGRGPCPSRGHDPDACPVCSWAMSGRRRTAERRADKPPWK